MESHDLKHYAKLFAELHLGEFDHMGVHELLEDEGIEYEDADADAIYELIIHANVVLEDLES